MSADMKPTASSATTSTTTTMLTAGTPLTTVTSSSQALSLTASMDSEHRRQAVRALIEAAAPHLPGVPPEHRATLYDGIAIVTEGLEPELSRTAQTCADQLRDAEIWQGRVMRLLKS